LSERDIKITNVADADFYPAFMTSQVKSIVAWKPGLSSIEAEPNASVVFSSNQIPGELVDIGMVNTQTLRDNPNFGKALVGAWHETLAAMQGTSSKAVAARELMASVAGTNIADFDSQLATTRLFVRPSEAMEFLRTPEFVRGVELMREFCFEHGLLGENAKSKDAIGIQMPGGKVLGNANNVRLRFDETYVSQAAAGKL
jgi:NitT/TauT family transport system substrate-binding protein